MTHAPTGQKCYCNERGWMPGIYHIPIQWRRPFYIVRDEGLMRPYVVVDHIMQGFQVTMDRWAIDRELPVIVQFSTSRVGRKVQYQSIYTEGVHVSAINSPTSGRVRTLGAIPHRGANPYSIGIENEGFSVDPGYSYDYIYSRANPWPEAMVEANIEIKRWIFEQADTNLGVPSRESIIGHYEVDARNRPDDPAAAADRSTWPVDRMIAALAPQQEEAPVAYTAAQRQWLDYFTGDGAHLTRDYMKRKLKDVQLTLADLDAYTGEEPEPPLPAGDGEEAWRAGYRQAAEYAAGRVGLLVTQAEGVKRQLEELAASPPERE